MYSIFFLFIHASESLAARRWQREEHYRTQPGLPCKKECAATKRLDYERHGANLFAALDLKSVMLIGDSRLRHRTKELLNFFHQIDWAVKKPRDMHIVLDNYPTQKAPDVQAWLKKPPRFNLHFTRTGASWLNQLERFSAEMITKNIRWGGYYSIDDLESSIYYSPPAAQRKS